MMEIKKRENKEFTRINIVGDLTIYNAQKCWQQFLLIEDVDVEKDIKLNLEKVDELDTSGLQILLQLCSSRYRRNVEIDNISEPLTDLLALLEITSIRV